MDRYRLVIHVFGDWPMSRVLKRMASGTVVVYSEIVQAKVAYREFIELASTATGGRKEILGVVVLLDTQERKDLDVCLI